MKQLSHQYCISRQSLGLLFMIMLATSPSSAYQINLAKKSQTKTTPHVDLITELDQNGDGQMSTDELHEDRFLRLDKDKNAILNAAELSIKRKGKKLTKQNRPENGRKTRNEIKLP